MADLSSLNLALLSSQLDWTIQVESDGDSIKFGHGGVVSRGTGGVGLPQAEFAPDEEVLKHAGSVDVQTENSWSVNLDAAAFANLVPLFPEAHRAARALSGVGPGVGVELLPVSTGVMPSGSWAHDRHVGAYTRDVSPTLRMVRCPDCGLFWFGRLG